MLKLARDIAMAGDDEDLSVTQHASAQRVLAEPDAHRTLQLLAEHVTGLSSTPPWTPFCARPTATITT
ncbi:MAG: hypothetical protein ABI873_16810 [Marmoricola sp.]